MNLFPEQVSAVGKRQLDAQLQLQLQVLNTVAGSALDGAEQFAALQFATTRNALEKSTELLRQVAAARDPRDLFALTKHARSSFDTLLAYQSRLFGIATAMSGAAVGLPRVVTPAASAALQKLASLPAIADVTDVLDVMDVVADQVEHVVSASSAAPAAAAAHAAAPAAMVDDIIEQTSEVVEALAEQARQEAAEALQAPTSAAPDDAAATPIAELTAVAAAAGHQQPQPSAAPMPDNDGIDVAPVAPAQAQAHAQAASASAPVVTTKSGGRQRKK